MAAPPTFPFLDLPKDIRLMVYDNIPIVTRQNPGGLEWKEIKYTGSFTNRELTSRFQVVTKHLARIDIVLTCRLVYEEALPLLLLRLEKARGNTFRILADTVSLPGVTFLLGMVPPVVPSDSESSKTLRKALSGFPEITSRLGTGAFEYSIRGLLPFFRIVQEVSNSHTLVDKTTELGPSSSSIPRIEIGLTRHPSHDEDEFVKIYWDFVTMFYEQLFRDDDYATNVQIRLIEERGENSVATQRSVEQRVPFGRCSAEGRICPFVRSTKWAISRGPNISVEEYKGVWDGEERLLGVQGVRVEQ